MKIIRAAKIFQNQSNCADTQTQIICFYCLMMYDGKYLLNVVMNKTNASEDIVCPDWAIIWCPLSLRTTTGIDYINQC